MTEFSDVYIIPQYSTVQSRSEVDTSVILDPFHKNNNIDVPVISANMDSVTDGNMAKEISKAGALGAIHRFMTIEENVKEYKKAENNLCLVSVGVSEKSKNRVSALYLAGARYFIIDIAHGHSKLMKSMVQWIRMKFPDVYIVGGNIATVEAVNDLVSWGVNAVKVGIGPGKACLTKNVTGVTVPQFHAISQCVSAAACYDDLTVIADGGVREIGDIAKAIGLGADFVMAGSMFASCKEAPLPGVYRGSASKDVMETSNSKKTLPTAEGMVMQVSNNGPSVHKVVKNIKGGLQSAFSYSNSRSLTEFQARCKFGFRKKQ